MFSATNLQYLADIIKKFRQYMFFSPLDHLYNHLVFKSSKFNRSILYTCHTVSTGRISELLHLLRQR